MTFLKEEGISDPLIEEAEAGIEDRFLELMNKADIMENQVITVRNLVKKFGSFIANDNLNFEVYRGEIFGFLGANGAGKTTAIRILSGLSKPTSGEVTLLDLMLTDKLKR